MSAAAPTSRAKRTSVGQASKDRSFFTVLGAIALSLLLLGGLGFAYLRANSPLGLLAGSGRPIAAATVFVPVRSPFTFSLLSRPERILAFQQAVVAPDQRQQARREITQVQQNLFKATDLDYERDIKPWVGEEITYAYTDVDLDQETANGEQPGYFLAVEIAPERQQQAQEFLQLFWQQRSLSGDLPTIEKISGVRVLSSNASSDSTLGAATALVGNHFVMFANDVRVIRHSIRASQTAQNLAQNSAYRQAADALPSQRLGLAYFDTALLKDGINNKDRQSPARGQREYEKSPLGLAESHLSNAPSRFIAVGIGVTRTGLTADLVPATAADRGKAALKRIDDSLQSDDSFVDLPSSAALQYLPADSELVAVGRSFAALESSLLSSGVLSDELPAFLQLGRLSPDNPWQQMSADYALAQISSQQSHDWILAVKRDESTKAVVQALNSAAAAAGYSVVPVPLGQGLTQNRSEILDESLDESSSKSEATAWTRFRVGNRRQQSSSGLDTELLGLHLQRDDYEIYASSVAAMNSALSAPSSSLQTSSRFLQAMVQLRKERNVPLKTANSGYLYLDWSAAAPLAEQVLPAARQFNDVARPLTRHISAIAVTRTGENASFYLQLTETSSH